MLTVLLLGGVTYANIVLHGRSSDHELAHSRLDELDMLLHEESSLQWKTLAKGNTPVRVARELGAIRSQEKMIQDELEVSDALRTQIAEYHAVLDTELGLLGVGRTAEALRLEQQRTDPAFVALADQLDRLGASQADAAGVARNVADLTLALAMAAAAGLIGLLLYRFEREHRISQRVTEEMLQQQQIALDTLTEHEALVRHQAMHDPLTGLPNRRALRELLAVGGRQALLLVDLDNFKPVNDQLGHAVGDELLISVARRLHGSVRVEDSVIRLGGDEFAVVIHDGDAAAAVHVAGRIVQQIGEAFDISGSSVRIGASVGIAIGYDIVDGDKLLHEADRAMYKVKQTGKGGYAIADPMEAPRDATVTAQLLPQRP
ncbi:GGDEF domain-containing protein [Couchioplanes caeruleus]|uniref:GGDEF domain-containing protein n=1 Tax=Couchioplanes caeruleus TaxID=56438 RepID=UPI0020BE3D2A|nr:GGDEF domain-containing protein [Couchioplanes caeruleus]UQU68633.1 GGDEF domain-containing protein [Couchioplanes caeruleus]